MLLLPHTVKFALQPQGFSIPPKINKSRAKRCTPAIPALRVHDQEDSHRLEASLAHTVSSRPARAI